MAGRFARRFEAALLAAGEPVAANALAKLFDPALDAGTVQELLDDLARRLAEEKVFALPPVGRLGLPNEVAMVACMLASPALGFVTGSNYRVDGGQIRAVV